MQILYKIISRYNKLNSMDFWTTIDLKIIQTDGRLGIITLSLCVIISLVQSRLVWFVRIFSLYNIASSHDGIADESGDLAHRCWEIKRWRGCLCKVTRNHCNHRPMMDHFKQQGDRRDYFCNIAARLLHYKRVQAQLLAITIIFQHPCNLVISSLTIFRKLYLPNFYPGF